VNSRIHLIAVLLVAILMLPGAKTWSNSLKLETDYQTKVSPDTSPQVSSATSARRYAQHFKRAMNQVRFYLGWSLLSGLYEIKRGANLVLDHSIVKVVSVFLFSGPFDGRCYPM